MQTRVMLIGIGGGSCSGKTTLTAKLCSVIPGCSVLHQDDFWTALEDIPMHPEYNLPRVEDPDVSIQWPRFRAAVVKFKSNPSSSGDLSDLNQSDPQLDPNPVKSSLFFSSLSDDMLTEWRDRFQQVEKEWLKNNVKIVWKIVEGFLLFYDPRVVEHLDVQIFLRSPRYILHQRRLGRTYTHSNGAIWADPPNYWEQIAYPGYVRAHSHLFHEGDIDAEDLSPEARASGLVVLEGQGTKQNLSFEEIFKTAASTVLVKSQLPK